MTDRNYWVFIIVIGGLIAFVWPYVFPPSGDKFADGLFRAGAWVAGSSAAFGVLHLISRADRIK